MKNNLFTFSIGMVFLLGFLAMVSPSSQGLIIGDVAPDFRLKNIDGKMVSLKDYKKAKGYIVIFSCNQCPFVIKYEDRMIELHQKFAAMGYPVIAINSNDPEVQPADSYELMVEKAKEKNFPFAYLFDEGQKVFPQYGATRTPQVYLLDKKRKVRYIGAIDDNADDATQVEKKYLEDAIMALEKGKDPDPTTTKAIGCSIKIKKK
jgi:peroxiredoxin